MMKKTIYYMVLAILLPLCTQARIWRVNNNAGVVADFNNLDAALATFQPGDSIYLEPSQTEYTVSGYLTSPAGQLTIIGNGYYLDQNIGLKENTLWSKLNVPNGVQKNVKLIGVTIPGIFVNTGGSISNIIFESCLFTGITSFWGAPTSSMITVSGLKFLKCFFTSTIQLLGSGYTAIDWTNFVFENNIILYSDFILRGASLSETSQKTVRNNTFYYLNNTIQITGAYIANNIFYKAIDNGSIQVHVYNYSITKNNIFTLTQQLEGTSLIQSGNIFGANPSSIFTNATGTSNDNYYKLSTNSPAIGAGVPNGNTPVDCGAFGGPNPYKLSGVTQIPAIYELTVPATVNTGTNVQISFKARSNN